MKLDVSIKFKNGYDAITKADTRAKNENKDCVVRAFMNAFDVSYNESHKFVEKHFDRKRKKGTFGTAGKMLKMADKSIPSLNSKEVVHIGSHPKKGLPGNILLNTQYPIFKRSRLNGETIIEKTFAGYTVGKFIQQHQHGTYIIIVAKHALAVKDGVMIDNGDQNDDLLNLQRRDQRRCEEIFEII
tara:strand:+ start:817 stop:1374 length:558 start_codon:yes stop_codon:yes gene_type:complete